MRRLGIFALPTSKRKLTIDQAEAALKQRGLPPLNKLPD